MKRINLDQMKNMSIDNLIESYRNGYRLEEHTSITSLSNLPNFSNIHTLQEPLLDPVTNFGKVIVSSCTGGCTATATEVTIDDGTKFPDPTTRAFNLIWWNSTDYADPSDDPNKEIVRCTAKSGNVLTITRAQEGTSASTKNSGGKVYKMILSVTKKTISDISSVITDRVAKSGDTMTGDLIFSGAQKIIGGTGTTSDLTLQTTSGVGTTGADIHFLVGNNGVTEAMTILNSGKVGIGTPIIGGKLAIDGDISFYTPVDGTIRHIYNSNWWDGLPRGGGAIRISSSGSDTAAKYISLGRVGNDQDIQTSFARDLTVDYNGYVGIGTTNPTKRLEISDSNAEIARFTSSAAAAGIGLKDTASGGLQWNLFSTATAAGEGAGKLAFNLNDVGTKMVIDSSGNVGIGTVSPGAKLEVYGGNILLNNIGNYLSTIQVGSGGNVLLDMYKHDTAASGYAYLKIWNGAAYSGIYLNGSGNVGIGTTNPLVKLDVSGTDAIKIPVGTIAQRPSPAAGMLRVNSTTLNLEYYNGSAWSKLVGSTVYASSGGTITEISGYRIHTFTSNGTLTVDIAGNAEVLIVAGGGGGGGSTTTHTRGGGGGGGGLIYATLNVVPQAYSVVVGGGGAGGTAGGGAGGAGSNSSFASRVAIGGGGGAGYSVVAGIGGSGGGGSTGTSDIATGRAGTSGQGNAGGNSTTYTNNTSSAAGGGGGAGTTGGNASGGTGGNGGSGLGYDISGTNVYYAGGGGGSAGITVGTGGNGGGANGVTGDNVGNAGTANTGGGGSGGASTTVASKTGGAGGSGIVIIRYLL